jgi:membrane-associated phospholipid phosphatase
MTLVRPAVKDGRPRVRTGWPWRWIAFGVVMAMYAVLTYSIIVQSPMLTLDNTLYSLHLHVRYPQYNGLVYYYELLGQRGPATLSFLPYFLWVSWRSRSTRPIVMLVTSLILLNVSVGIVKLATGRLGPQQTRLVHQIFLGGDIYPSGHVSNAVVLYGLVAWIALRFRKTAIAAAVFVCVTVSAGTIYLNTHWLSDLLGGILAGALVLLVLPTVMPTAQAWADIALTRLATRYTWLKRFDPRPTAYLPPSARVAIGSSRIAGSSAPQFEKSTPVSSEARSHSVAASAGFFDTRDEPTR